MRSKMCAAMSGSKMYVFGGLGAGPVGELWAFDLALSRWSPVRTAGANPPGRCGHSMTTDAEGRLWLFGGQAGMKEKGDFKKDGAAALRVRMLNRREVYSDTWYFDPRSNHGRGAWHELTLTGISPSPRRGHSATLVQGRDLTGGGANSESRQSQPLHELLVVGGAGPDPGKGFETVHGQVWSFDIRRKEWSNLDLKGAGPEAWGRFEHSATLVPGGMAGVGSGQTLVVVGGLTGSSLDSSAAMREAAEAAAAGGDSTSASSTVGGMDTTGNGTSSSGGGASYTWGGCESRVVALAVDTLTWVVLVCHADLMRETSLLHAATGGGAGAGGDSTIPSPSLHGHTTCAHPSNPRELLVFGGRGNDAHWHSDTLALTLPPPHVPGTAYPNMPKAPKGGKNGSGSSGGLRNTLAAQTRSDFGDTGDDAFIPEPVVVWDSLIGVNSDSSVVGATVPEARYGHACAAWPVGLTALHGRKKSNKETSGPESHGASPTNDGADYSPPGCGLLLFGGSLFSGLGSSGADTATAGGGGSSSYASNAVHFLDLEDISADQLRGRGWFGSHKSPSNSVSQSHHASTTSRPGSGGSVGASVGERPSTGGGGGGLASSDWQGLFSNSQDDGGGVGGSSSAGPTSLLGTSGQRLTAFPVDYRDMKTMLLSQRSSSDQYESRHSLSYGSRGTQGFGSLTSPSGLGNTGGSSSSRHDVSTGSSHGSRGHTAGGALGSSSSSSSVRSTMAYQKTCRLAQNDPRFGPSPHVIERSILMQGILKEPVFPPALPAQQQASSSRGGDPEGANSAGKGSESLALYGALLARQQRPLTADEIYAKKQLKPMTPKEVWAAKWRVPGFKEMVEPPPRPVITAVEARRRFKAVTADPFASEYT